MKQITTRIAGLAVAAAMWIGATNSAFGIITFEINTLLPGQTVPVIGTTPWAKVTIDQDGDNVNLIISTGNGGGWGITGTEFISSFFLNYENSGDATLNSLVFNQTPTSPVVPIERGLNNHKADGTGGYFDLEFKFPTSNEDPDRFLGGKTFSYVISSALGSVVAEDFVARSTEDKQGNGALFYTAAHIQAIGGDEDSSWAAGSTTPVPEPTTMIAGLLLLLPFAASTLRFLRRKQRAV